MEWKPGTEECEGPVPSTVCILSGSDMTPKGTKINCSVAKKKQKKKTNLEMTMTCGLQSQPSQTKSYS